MKIARVIVTWDCMRDCDICCNKNLPVEAKPCSIEDLADFDQALITGGEPMLYPVKTLEIIRALETQRWAHGSSQKVYLYTALNLFSPQQDKILDIVDGVHYTLHYPLRRMDMVCFYQFQEWVGRYKNSHQTFRLMIDPRIEEEVKVIPSVWIRVESKPWLTDLKLPEGEELFQLC